MQPGRYNPETGQQEVYFDNPHETAAAKQAYNYRGFEFVVKRNEDGSSETITTDPNIDPVARTTAVLETLSQFTNDRHTKKLALDMIEECQQNCQELTA